jgi:AcrR family transcriptional regulator
MIDQFGIELVSEIPEKQRERSKEGRRLAILLAANDLIRETGGTDFTMVELSKRARVGATTPYNLFGTKAAILYRLLYSSTDVILERTSAPLQDASPMNRALTVIDTAIDIFVSDPTLYKPLFKFLLAASDPDYRPGFVERASNIWAHALSGIEEASPLAKDLTKDRIIRQFKAMFIGFLDSWILDATNDVDFRNDVLTGVGLLMMNFASETDRTAARARIVGLS